MSGDQEGILPIPDPGGGPPDNTGFVRRMVGATDRGDHIPADDGSLRIRRSAPGMDQDAHLWGRRRGEVQRFAQDLAILQPSFDELASNLR